MKKFLCTFLIFILIWGTVYATSFRDTIGLDCEDAVNLISDLGIVNGTGNGLYEPNKSLTRAELSKMVVLSLKLKMNNSNAKTFSDLANHWGKEYISTATNNNILKGYEDGTFRPDKEVTYAEAIAIMMRSMGYQGLEQNYKNVWYENYLIKMKEAGLNVGAKEFNPDSYANRGDIAIFLKNMILFLNDSKSNFWGLSYWDGFLVEKIYGYDGKVWFETSIGNFYMDENVDLGNLGAYVSGYYDNNTKKMYGAKFYDSVETIRKSGNAKDVSNEISSDVFNCKNIYGYGEPEYAKYVDAFVDASTNKVVRVVFFDTRDNHFAEKIKVGSNKVSIESKDVYDESIIEHKGKRIVFHFLRNESVMDIDINTIAIYNGKITKWENIPTNVDITYIKGANICECNSKTIDAKIKTMTRSLTLAQIGKETYKINEECLCRNIKSDETVKLHESFDYDDLMLINKNDETLRFYLNKYNEIVKVEYKFDILKYKIEKENNSMLEAMKKYMEYLEIVTDLQESFKIENDKVEVTTFVSTKASPDSREHTYTIGDSSLKLGDLLYTESGEKKLVKLGGKTTIGSGEVITNYMYDIVNNRMGMYYVNDDTEYIEVLVEIDDEDKEKYSDCDLKYISADELEDIKNYKNMYIIADANGFILRLYAIEEIGSKYNYGIVKSIENNYSGDKYINTLIKVINTDNGHDKYYTMYTQEYDVGDLISFTIKTKGSKETYDTLQINESYNHKNLDNEKDLIVKKIKGNTIYFEDTDFVLDLDDDKYDNFIFIKADIKKQEDEWIFTSADIVSKRNTIFAKDYYVAISELTNTIVIYRKVK